MMALLMAKACKGGGDVEESAVRYASAAELLHNATLLHDDVADDSDQRRGVPTVRSLMGPSVSVLLGDYWLVKAMELILKDAPSDIKVIRIFSKTLSDLAEGEMLQLQKAQKGEIAPFLACEALEKAPFLLNRHEDGENQKRCHT